MGLTNTASYTTNSGVVVSNSYISFAYENLYLKQVDANAGAGSVTTYKLHANYRVYWNQSARNNNLGFIDLKPISITLTSAQLSSNPYTLLYNQLKTVYASTTDVL